MILVDTNILVHVCRGSPLGRHVIEERQLRAREQTPLISVVTVGELFAFARKLGWAEPKRNYMHEILADLVVASGTLVELHGHTDNAGNAEANMKLSEDRAFAVKRWLEKQAPSSFPEDRVKVMAHGQTEPVAPNSTAEGKAKNRRVVVVLGTSS